MINKNDSVAIKFSPWIVRRNGRMPDIARQMFNENNEPCGWQLLEGDQTNLAKLAYIGLDVVKVSNFLQNHHDHGCAEMQNINENYED